MGVRIFADNKFEVGYLLQTCSSNKNGFHQSNSIHKPFLNNIKIVFILISRRYYY